MLVGREADCARIDQLLERARRGRSGSLAVRGEAGIGKTALLEFAVERAEGMTVVRALGVESEAELQFSGLLELLRPLEDHLPSIPEQQAAALRGALGHGKAEGHDRFTVGAATLSLLAAAAEARPLLVVVDDAQWLDTATSEALLFAARRLVADAVALLFAIRADDGRVELAGVDMLDLGGIAPEDALRLLGSVSTRAVARRLFEATAGNPLALLEARRQLSGEQLAGREPLPEPLPAGPELESAFARRAASLPADSRRALGLVAVALPGEDAVETIAAALQTLGLAPAVLEPAEDAELIAIASGRVVFHHPLVRSAIHHRAAPSERRAAHRALADSLGERVDGERRAWHLAGAALGHDDEAATALELAARQAVERSRYAAAAAALCLDDVGGLRR